MVTKMQMTKIKVSFAKGHGMKDLVAQKVSLCSGKENKGPACDSWLAVGCPVLDQISLV